jgi:hypothetical protein
VQKLFSAEKPGGKILREKPIILAFRNEKYRAMFMEANQLR